MPSYLAEHLSTARHRLFIGRARELALFRSGLVAAAQSTGDNPAPFYVLYVFGPGGVGKTTLLREFAQICEQAETLCIYLDARNLQPTSESFLSALRVAIGLPPSKFPPQFLAAQGDRVVILIDTYERLLPLDEWLREVFLPQLPENTLVVLASRYAPAVAWRADPGWRTLVRLLPLSNLTSGESRTYLSQQEIPPAQHQAVLAFTHGHPLALSLVADLFAQAQDYRFQPEAAPDVIKALLEKFIQKVPSLAHRAALEACAITRLTTEASLTQMLAMPDVHELFEWLRELSFIESGQLGLFPHDSAREVLAADLRWRNFDWYRELHLRSRSYYAKRLGQTQGQEQQRVLLDYIFLHRHNSAVKSYFTWQDSSLMTDVLRDDQSALIEMVARHEGEASARLIAYWLKQQPQGVLIFRDAKHQPAGFVSIIALHQASAEDRRVDPAIDSTRRYLQEQAPLRPGEGATLLRFWMAHDTYQAVSPIQSLIFINFMQHHRSTPGLAFTFFACAEPEQWAEIFAYADLARLPDVDFEVGGQGYGVYGHDWRVTSPAAWQELLACREIAPSVQATPSSERKSLLVLSQAEFELAVLNALRDFSRPDALYQNPLLQSRLVAARVSPDAETAERAAVLQARITTVAESLQTSPREAKYYRALYYTYLHPAPTQEQAAEVLGLPFSTFRRHLKLGITRVTSILWHQEIG